MSWLADIDLDTRRKGHSRPVNANPTNKGQYIHGVVTTTSEGRVTHSLSTRGFDANPRTRSIPKKDARKKTKVR